METIEYRVKPVVRYVVTRYKRSANSGSCGAVGDFANREIASQIAEALAQKDGGQVVPSPGHGSAIVQLRISAETCENNAPIHEAEGNHEQADCSRKNAAAYRAAIAILADSSLLP